LAAGDFIEEEVYCWVTMTWTNGVAGLGFSRRKR
jgi:hypothetical protein